LISKTKIINKVKRPKRSARAFFVILFLFLFFEQTGKSVSFDATAFRRIEEKRCIVNFSSLRIGNLNGTVIHLICFQEGVPRDFQRSPPFGINAAHEEIRFIVNKPSSLGKVTPNVLFGFLWQSKQRQSFFNIEVNNFANHRICLNRWIRHVDPCRLLGYTTTQDEKPQNYNHNQLQNPFHKKSPLVFALLSVLFVGIVEETVISTVPKYSKVNLAQMVHIHDNHVDFFIILLGKKVSAVTCLSIQSFNGLD